jgi:stage V sporulation protein G
MEITEVRIKLMEDPSERLQAFCSITFDHAFVIRDLKIIGGTNGAFVAMPSRRLTSHCSQCGGKNHLKAAYCNQCGMRLKHDGSVREDEGRAKLYADIAHPINQACRDMIQQKVIEAFQLEQERAKQPGYVSSYDDFDEDVAPPPRRSGGQPPRRDSAHREPAHREPARSEQGRHEPGRQEPSRQEPRGEPPVVRRTAPVVPAGPSAPPRDVQKIEPPVTEPPAPHTNLIPGQDVDAPSSAQTKKTSFGEGIL